MAAKTIRLALEGFGRSEEVNETTGKVYVAMAWLATDGSGAVIQKATGLHESYADAYREAKKILNISENDSVVDRYGEWPS